MTAQIPVDMETLAPQSVPIIQPQRHVYRVQTSSIPLKVTPPLRKDLPVPAVPVSIEQKLMKPVDGEASITTVYEPEQVLMPYFRAFTYDYPLPDWLSKVPNQVAHFEFQIQVPTEEVTEATANEPKDWTLAVNTRTLFTTVLPYASAFLVGQGLRPHVWTIALAGVLADVAVMPKRLSFTLQFRTQTLPQVNLDFSSDLRLAVSEEELVPPGGDGELLADGFVLV